MAAPTVGAILRELLPYLEVPKEHMDPIFLSDFRGMTPGDVQKAVKEQGLKVKIVGEGSSVISQIPLPGMAAEPGSEILIYLGKQEETS